jgi:hypothetical protein
MVFLLALAVSSPAFAAHHKKARTAPDSASDAAVAENGKTAPATEPAAKAGADKGSLQFDFFGGDAAGATGGSPSRPGLDLDAKTVEAKSDTRRWMLTVHQTLGIATWALMGATVVVGQLNYNQLYGGGGGSNKWQTPHRWLVLSSSTAFAATGAFALFAPSPYKKPLRFDTALVHRLAVIGATAGMLAEVVLGWTATHQANAGNPNNLRTYARAHQVIGYTTFGFLTIAGAVWVF